MSSRTQLSIVSPVYNAEKIIPELVKRISENVQTFTADFEIVLVEDGSSDGSWKAIEEECRKSFFIKGIKLSRNFGQHQAISAGLKAAKGDYVVVMDCDLQDNPKYIKDLYAKTLEGYDIVYTSKKQRQHNLIKNIIAKMYFIVFNYLTDNQRADDKTGAYSILSRKAVDAFCQIKDFHRHYLNIIRVLGFKSTTIKIEHQERYNGKSSYTFNKLLWLAMDGITSQSDKLLKISIKLGFVLFVASFAWATYLVVMYFIRGALPGYTSLMAMLLLSTGLILISIGITGIYIGKIFEQSKGRPLYFIDRELNF